MVALSSFEKPPMGRPRKKNTHLPPCVYPKHGAYYLVKKGVWERLGSDLSASLAEYGRRFQPQTSGGMPKLIREAMLVIKARPDLAKNSKAQYESAARTLEEAFADFQPEQVRSRDIRKLKRGMAELQGSFNSCLSVLRAVFEYAIEEELLEDNPATGIKGYKPKARKRLLSAGEFDAIYAHAAPRLRCMMDVWRLTGQRVMDVVTIRRKDLLPEGISFRQQKTDERLTVAWNPELEAAVARAKALNGNVRSLSLFSATQGKNRGSAPSHGAIWPQWAAACKAAGVEDAQMRDLRAVSGSAAKRQGKNPQALLGHTKEATTLIYLRDKESPLVEGPSFGQLSNIGRKK